MKIYTGIGSREAPQDIIVEMIGLGSIAAIQGWVLRSGGAEGADSAFEQGCDEEKGSKEIYLPWYGFNNHSVGILPTHQAFLVAQNIWEKRNRVWSYAKDTVKKIMARNAMQVVGSDLKTPTSCIICWTKNGKDEGGTAQAIIHARSLNIPIYNIAIPGALEDAMHIIMGESK